MWYKEWASQPSNRKGRMLPLSSFQNILKLRDTGYESVYYFSESDALKIKQNENSKGMNRLSVGSDRLMIDIDKGEDGLQAVGKILEDKGYGFKLYSSGSKGYHIELSHIPLYDKRLPYSHKHFLKSLLGKAFEYVDPTLYQHGRLISLVGRIHPITRRKKVLIKEFPGKQVEIPIVDEPEIESTFKAQIEPLSHALLKAFDASSIEPNIGQRHMVLWRVGKSLSEAGLSSDTTQEILEGINESWDNPKESKDVLQVVKSIYHK